MSGMMSSLAESGYACKLSPTQNMMDACRELYSFFDNSPKRQSFLADINAIWQPQT